MKKHIVFLLSGALLVCAPMYIVATPVGGSVISQRHLIAARNLDRWSAGANFAAREREVTIDGGDFEMKQNLVKGYVGWDALRWATAYAIVGGHNIDLGADVGNYELIYGAGASFYLLDHELASLWLLEDSFQFSASIEYTRGKMDSGFGGDSYSELYSAMTLSFVNKIETGRTLGPDAISLFGGPVVSVLGDDLEQKTSWGANFGVKVFLTDKVSFYAGAEYLDTSSFIAGIEFGM